MSVFELRPHHALCIRFFQGKGYSADFTANMYGLLLALDADPMIRLQCACDVLCAHCPHNRADICRSDAKVRDFDQQVLTRCGLHPGDALHWSALSALVENHILKPSRLHEICAACEWYGICGNSVVLR